MHDHYFVLVSVNRAESIKTALFIEDLVSVYVKYRIDLIARLGR